MVRASIVVALLSIAPALACDKQASQTERPGEDSVDQLSRDLLAALRDGDLDKLHALCTPTLAAELDERTLVTLGRTLGWLGFVHESSRIDETPVSGGVERHYRVQFEVGSELTLRVTVVGGKVEGFEFDADQWEAVSERATEASAGSLRIAEFAFVGPDGGPLGGPLDPGDIRYSLALEGLDAQLREHHVVIAKQVFDPDGNVVYRQRENDDIRFPQAETDSSGGTITGAVAVPGPGTYELELKITDLVAGQILVHRVAIEI